MHKIAERIRQAQEQYRFNNNEVEIILLSPGRPSRTVKGKRSFITDSDIIKELVNIAKGKLTLKERYELVRQIRKELNRPTPFFNTTDYFAEKITVSYQVVVMK